jgi:RNA polymerase sigma factor (sigma-70 family)
MEKLLKMSDGEYIKMNFDQCYEQYKYMIKSQCNKLLPAFKNEYDDLYQCGFRGLFRAFADYDIGKNTCFSTIAFKYIYTEIHLYSRNNKQYLKLISLNDMFEDKDGRLREYENKLLQSDGFVDDVIDKIDIQKDINSVKTAMESLNPLHREILEKYFFEGVKQKDIAESFSLTQNYISTVIKKSLGKIREQYNLKRQAEELRKIDVFDEVRLDANLENIKQGEVYENSISSNKSRIIEIARYILINKSTTREAAKQFNLSTSTVSRYMSKYLKDIDDMLYNSVQEVLKGNRLRCPWNRDLD